jgi:hypothetical protein
MPSRALYTALAAVRSVTVCRTVLIPWVDESLMALLLEGLRCRTD